MNASRQVSHTLLECHNAVKNENGLKSRDQSTVELVFLEDFSPGSLLDSSTLASNMG